MYVMCKMCATYTNVCNVAHEHVCNVAHEHVCNLHMLHTHMCVICTCCTRTCVQLVCNLHMLHTHMYTTCVQLAHVAHAHVCNLCATCTCCTRTCVQLMCNMCVTCVQLVCMLCSHCILARCVQCCRQYCTCNVYIMNIMYIHFQQFVCISRNLCIYIKHILLLFNNSYVLDVLYNYIEHIYYFHKSHV